MSAILQAKEMATSNTAAQELALFQQIFGIEEDVQQEVRLQQQEKPKNEQVGTDISGNPSFSY